MSVRLLQCSVFCFWFMQGPAIEYFLDISGSKALKAILIISSAILALTTVPAPGAASGQTDPSRTEAAAQPLATVTSAEAANLQTSATGSLPSRGMTMAQVEQSHGAPAMRKAAVGNPPITRWEYEGFIVYFEYRHVIHSVAKITR